MLSRLPEPEWLGPGRCMQPRASLGLFPVEQPMIGELRAGRPHNTARRINKPKTLKNR